MIKLPLIHIDCVHFFGDRPCKPNKEYGVFCEGCEFYEKDEKLAKTTDDKLVIRPYEYPMGSITSIVIIKLDAVGDVLRTTSILPSLRTKYPEAGITWITKEKSLSVIKDNPELEKVISTESDVFGQLMDGKEKFDIAINLDSGKESCGIMMNIDASVSFGYTIKLGKPWPVNELANEWYLMGVNDNVKKENRKTYHRIIHEICGLRYNNSKPFLNVTDEIKDRSDGFRNKMDMKKYNGFILINLGGGNRWQNKKWTEAGFISAVNVMSEKHPEKLFGLIAGDEDRDFYNRVISKLNKKKNIYMLGCDNTKEEFTAIVNLADKVLTSDSLGMHIATALDKYTVVLVGPTSYTELDVFGNGRIVHSDKMECKCFYSAVCTEDIDCMNTIKPETVINALGL